mmetsp:Transcript_30177/g.85232  ORF Transcript_30177/g.85232 Transcript_30177/m.85232 type:complete len:205 (+) Transcript_30177:1006-1620(+)
MDPRDGDGYRLCYVRPGVRLEPAHPDAAVDVRKDLHRGRLPLRGVERLHVCQHAKDGPVQVCGRLQVLLLPQNVKQRVFMEEGTTDAALDRCEAHREGCQLGHPAYLPHMLVAAAEEAHPKAHEPAPGRRLPGLEGANRPAFLPEALQGLTLLVAIRPDAVAVRLRLFIDAAAVLASVLVCIPSPVHKLSKRSATPLACEPRKV